MTFQRGEGHQRYHLWRAQVALANRLDGLIPLAKEGEFAAAHDAHNIQIDSRAELATAGQVAGNDAPIQMA
jgi:hypothetical protein